MIEMKFVFPVMEASPFDEASFPQLHHHVVRAKACGFCVNWR